MCLDTYRRPSLCLYRVPVRPLLRYGLVCLPSQLRLCPRLPPCLAWDALKLSQCGVYLGTPLRSLCSFCFGFALHFCRPACRGPLVRLAPLLSLLLAPPCLLTAPLLLHVDSSSHTAVSSSSPSATLTLLAAAGLAALSHPPVGFGFCVCVCVCVLICFQTFPLRFL